MENKERLFSYVGLYGVLIGIPVFSAGIIILFSIFAIEQIGIAFVPVVPAMLYWALTFRRWKKVYYERGTLYIFSPFTNILTIVHKENVGSVNKLMFYDPRFFKIVFYDDNNDAKTVYFQRNWFLSDFNEIIDKFSE